MTLLSILNVDYSHLYNNELLLLSKTLSTLPNVGGICKTFRQTFQSRLNFLKQVDDARKLDHQLLLLLLLLFWRIILTKLGRLSKASVDNTKILRSKNVSTLYFIYYYSINFL